MPKRTAFYDKHVKAGGRMVEFVGFQMPMSYGKGIMAEVKRVRTTAGLFDVSHMGEIEIRGSDALEFVNLIITNDAAKLEEFQVQYACLCYPDGGIVDDLLVYRLPDKYLLVVNASNTLKDYEWIQDNRIDFGGSVLIKNTSDAVAQLALQGPASEEILSGLVDFDLSTMAYYWSRYGETAGKGALVSRTGYTGEDGFEIYSNIEDAGHIWDAVLDAGSKLDIEPVALGARDLLRLEMGYCLYGNDIDETTNPLEAGLGWITKLTKEHFVGREQLLAQKDAGLKRRLVGFELEGRPIARHGYPIFAGGAKVGAVTSGSFSPTIEKSIGMGYVDVNLKKEGTEIEVDIRGSRTRGVIVKTPFVENTSIKK